MERQFRPGQEKIERASICASWDSNPESFASEANALSIRPQAPKKIISLIQSQ